ncbi:nucleolar DEAD-box protein required for synthesis of 60S ribosomal subunit [Puccinia graminis f. sp. tritici]|uniref:Nucleolar DEAD-box protein required for synthesis of 60S ribosomal subunit n=1 Tax=Puccinia graminis f. sp. tritici TaxID=56615 RepID=A0A5B0MDI7_PUCGR|nr:nucleolar DEAD-box protein required for synthesis of 60S ribosomal subunit [Puccinia graminis f. sp. tritici]
MSDFIFTIDSEDEETIPTAPSAKHKNITSKKPQKKPKQQDEPTLELNPNFLLDGLGLDPDSNSERRSNRSKLLVSPPITTYHPKEKCFRGLIFKHCPRMNLKIPWNDSGRRTPYRGYRLMKSWHDTKS